MTRTNLSVHEKIVIRERPKKNKGPVHRIHGGLIYSSESSDEGLPFFRRSAAASGLNLVRLTRQCHASQPHGYALPPAAVSSKRATATFSPQLFGAFSTETCRCKIFVL